MKMPPASPRTILIAVLAATLPLQLLVGLGRRAPANDEEPRPASTSLAGSGGALPLVPTQRPSRRKQQKPTPTPTPPPPVVRDGLDMFAGLGAWIDVFDYDALDATAAIEDMRARGVRTLYIQTGKYNFPEAVDRRVAPWLTGGHAAGMSVVAWYLPSYSRMNFEVKRMIAAAEYETAGHRFDGIGFDIEYKGEVRDPATWNARVVEHMRRVTEQIPDDLPVAGIVPPPLQMDVAPTTWADFPWEGIAEYSDVIMLMSYWSFRDCDGVPDHCAEPFTRKSIERTRELTGRPDIPIHTIGGVGDSVTAGEVRDMVRGAIAADAFGISIYDYRTTEEAFWRHLGSFPS